jgi:natural product precursor
MKKLNKLEINSDKIMNNSELTRLRGGYEQVCCWCTGPGYWGRMAALSENDCRLNCAAINSLYDWKC